MRWTYAVRLTAFALCVSGLLMVSAWACNVPVFRYALDHWLADDYLAIIVHHGPLPEQSQADVDQLQAYLSQRACNLKLHTIDTTGSISASDQAYLDLQAQTIGVDAPHLLLHYPEGVGVTQPIFSSPLHSGAISSLVNSPLRQQLIQRLVAGQSAVWILVRSGDSAQDKAAQELVEHELRKLQATMELPKLTDAPEDAVVGGPSLRVEFSLLTVEHDSSAERELVAMLLHSEPDLLEARQPILFATFGRARVLWPLVGAGITTENLSEMAYFVVGACSCQVKQQNPGFDLLVKADWPALLPWTENLTPVGTAKENEQLELVPIPSGIAIAESRHESAVEPVTGWDAADHEPVKSTLTSAISAMMALSGLLLAGAFMIGVLAIMRNR